MNSLNFKLVLNWPQLCVLVCVCVVRNLARTSWLLLLLLAPTIIWQHTSQPDSCVAFWARPIILITRTLCLLLLLLLLDSCLLRLLLRLRLLPQLQVERQLQRHLLFVFIKKILQRQHEINTEAKVHARTKAQGTRTRSISVASCTHTHTQHTPFVSRRCLSDGGD